MSYASSSARFFFSVRPVNPTGRERSYACHVSEVVQKKAYMRLTRNLSSALLLPLILRLSPCSFK